MKDIVLALIARTDDAVIGVVVLFGGLMLAGGVAVFLGFAGNALLEWAR